jgi:predicted DNA-binding ribbon-helix-helix protein
VQGTPAVTSRSTTSRLISRTFVCTHGPTTMRLEPELWDMLVEIARREGLSTSALLRKIDASRGNNPRTSACRVYILNYCYNLMVDGRNNYGDYSQFPEQRQDRTVPKMEVTKPAWVASNTQDPRHAPHCPEVHQRRPLQPSDSNAVLSASRLRNPTAVAAGGANAPSGLTSLPISYKSSRNSNVVESETISHFDPINW